MPLQGSLAYPLGVPPGGLSSDQVCDLILQLLPVGAARLYGLRRRAGDPYNFYAAVADSLKAFWYDGIAILRQEINPATTAYKLGEWEAALGLSQTPIALGGNGTARRAQIISKLREQGAFTVANIKAILGPLLGISPANVTVVETNFASVKAAHTYSNGLGMSVAANGTTTQAVSVQDGGVVTPGAAIVNLTLTTTNPEQLSFSLSAPVVGNAARQTAFAAAAGVLPAGALVGGSAVVRFTGVAGLAFTPGYWLLQVSTGAVACTVASWSLLVEGTTARQDTAGARFWFGVYADPAHLGETGATNLAAARAAIQRVAPAFGQGRLLQSISGAWPDTSSGVNAAIPDEFLPA